MLIFGGERLDKTRRDEFLNNLDAMSMHLHYKCI